MVRYGFCWCSSLIALLVICVGCGRKPRRTSDLHSTPRPPLKRPVQQSAWPGDGADYTVDLGLVLDFEDIRLLVEGCADIGALEPLRRSLEAAMDLEVLRATLERKGIVYFCGCPEGVTGSGISAR